MDVTARPADGDWCRCLLAVTLLVVHDAHCRCPQP